MCQPKRMCFVLALIFTIAMAETEFPSMGTEAEQPVAPAPKSPPRTGGRTSADLSAVLSAEALAKEKASAKAEGFVNFSFDQVDVRAFVKLVGDITGRKFVVADGVDKKITVVAPQVSRREVYPLFVKILEANGCSVIEDNDVYRVVLLAPRTTPAAPVVGVYEQTPAQGIVTKVMRLEHISAGELQKVLESKVGGGKTGAIGAIEETNHLLITDTAESIRRIEKIVAEIDKPGLARTTEVVSLEFAGAEDLADQLNLAMSESESRGEQLKKRLPSVPGSRAVVGRSAVVAAPHSNSLILIGTASQIAELKRIIKIMDVEAPSGRGRLNAIFLKYISAEEAAKSINTLLGRPADKDKGAPQSSKIAIEASVANNALLVDSSLGDYEAVKRLIDQLDQAPQQVHIEVLIAEVSVSDALNLGVEMAAVDMPSKIGSTVIQGSSRFSDSADSMMNSIQQGIFPKGITIGVAHGTSVDSEGNVVAGFPGMINIDAIKKDGRFEVLSETSLEAQNNREATVSIVDQIPILKSIIEGSGSDRDIIQNIDRMDVGIKLKITPHVIPGGDVRMVLNPSIEAVSDPGPTGTQFAPTIARREVSTTVTVPDGRTIVIAGLTRKDKTKVVKKVPLLGSIPLLGVLFRYTTDETKKTDLLIFVTPHIVTDIAAAENVMEDWKDKTGLEVHGNK